MELHSTYILEADLAPSYLVTEIVVCKVFCHCIMLRENSHKCSDLTNKFVDIFNYVTT